VFVDVDGDPAMAVLPAPRFVDLDQLRALTGARELHILGETDFVSRFPDCDPGAEPPFGQLYGVKVYLDESLTHEPEVVFKAGSHETVVKMPLQEFLQINPPTAVGKISSSVKRRF
jgi:Ala-tRNA(Pro) deacylase